jgi:gliding motility-associated protein GldM
MKLNNLQSKPFFRSLFIIIALISSISSNAQNSVAIAPSKMNVLYIGVDNPISIAAYGTTDDKTTVSIDGGGGTVSKLSAGNYVVHVNQVTDDCTIQVNVDGKPVGSSKFRVRALPAPMATIGGFLSGSNVSADAFKNQAGVAAYLRDSPFEVKYEIASYAFTIDTDKGDIVVATNNTPSFSQQTKQAIEQYVKPGKTITIDNILASGPDGKVRKLPSLVYYIK